MIRRHSLSPSASHPCTAPQWAAATGWRACARLAALATLAGAALVMLSGCVATSGPRTFDVQENFNSATTFSRLFDATPTQTCEAARRALLSQGYIVGASGAELVEGKKSFQPDAESHLQMTVRVVCVPEANEGKVSLGFVTALQDTYALRKTNNSASVGVGAIGSVSLPFSASSDSLVKVGSATVTKDTFYENFFDLVKRYLVIDQAQADQAQ
ncbi:hypothetical protein BSY15_206 [Acidovorax sp. RAC01]|nr:hypothetical protein BSY15_206 [Acidovorax sp. RAC01]